MITQSDRDVGIMAHLTLDVKERFRAEAERRKMSMSLLVSQIIEKWLGEAEIEQIQEKRSNKRKVFAEDKETGIRIKVVDPLRDIPLPLGESDGKD